MFILFYGGLGLQRGKEFEEWIFPTKIVLISHYAVEDVLHADGYHMNLGEVEVRFNLSWLKPLKKKSWSYLYQFFHKILKKLLGKKKSITSLQAILKY